MDPNNFDPACCAIFEQHPVFGFLKCAVCNVSQNEHFQSFIVDDAEEAIQWEGWLWTKQTKGGKSNWMSFKSGKQKRYCRLKGVTFTWSDKPDGGAKVTSDNSFIVTANSVVENQANYRMSALSLSGPDGGGADATVAEARKESKKYSWFVMQKGDTQAMSWAADTVGGRDKWLDMLHQAKEYADRIRADRLARTPSSSKGLSHGESGELEPAIVEEEDTDEAFERIDTNKDGVLSREEFENAVGQDDLPPVAVRERKQTVTELLTFDRRLNLLHQFVSVALLQMDVLTTTMLPQLHDRLKREGNVWVVRFLRSGGVSKLTVLLAKVHAKPMHSFRDATVQMSTVRCLRALLNSRVGMDALIKDQDLDSLLLPAMMVFEGYGNSMAARKGHGGSDAGPMLVREVCELLAALCVFSLDGMVLVQQVFIQLAARCDHLIFRDLATLLDPKRADSSSGGGRRSVALGSSNGGAVNRVVKKRVDTSAAIALMGLVNALISSPADWLQRLRIREQIRLAGVDRSVDSLIELVNDTLDQMEGVQENTPPNKGKGKGRQSIVPGSRDRGRTVAEDFQMNAQKAAEHQEKRAQEEVNGPRGGVSVTCGVEWDANYMGEGIKLEEGGLQATAWLNGDEGGHALRAKQPLPRTGLHYVEYVYTRPQRKQGGNLGGYYMVGVVADSLKHKAYVAQQDHSYNAVYHSRAWWGLEDDGSVFVGEKKHKNLAKKYKNKQGRAYGSGDRVGMEIDMNKGTIKFFRNGEPLKGTEITGLPTSRDIVGEEGEWLHLVACPFHHGASVKAGVQINAPKHKDPAEDAEDDEDGEEEGDLVGALPGEGRAKAKKQGEDRRKSALSRLSSMVLGSKAKEEDAPSDRGRKNTAGSGVIGGRGRPSLNVDQMSVTSLNVGGRTDAGTDSGVSIVQPMLQGTGGEAMVLLRQLQVFVAMTAAIKEHETIATDVTDINQLCQRLEIMSLACQPGLKVQLAQLLNCVIAELTVTGVGTGDKMQSTNKERLAALGVGAGEGLKQHHHSHSSTLDTAVNAFLVAPHLVGLGEWQCRVDPKSHSLYYFRRHHNGSIETRWTRPAAVGILPYDDTMEGSKQKQLRRQLQLQRPLAKKEAAAAAASYYKIPMTKEASKRKMLEPMAIADAPEDADDDQHEAKAITRPLFSKQRSSVAVSSALAKSKVRFSLAPAPPLLQDDAEAGGEGEEEVVQLETTDDIAREVGGGEGASLDGSGLPPTGLPPTGLPLTAGAQIRHVHAGAAHRSFSAKGSVVQLTRGAHTSAAGAAAAVVAAVTVYDGENKGQAVDDDDVDAGDSPAPLNKPASGWFGSGWSALTETTSAVTASAASTLSLVGMSDSVVSWATNSVRPAPEAPSIDTHMEEASKQVTRSHPKYKKFALMLKMGLPEGAVRQKMSTEELTEMEIDAFFAAPSLPAPLTTTPPTTAPPEASKNAAPKKEGVAADEGAAQGHAGGAAGGEGSKVKTLEEIRADPKFAKYVKMQHMHLPEGAIRQKMATEGLPEEDIAAFWGEGFGLTKQAVAVVRTDPKYSKFVMMLKMHLPDGAVRQKMMAEGINSYDIATFFGEAPAGVAAPTPAMSMEEARTLPKFAKFAKMLKMHLPEGAVKQKMAAEGVSAADIAMFFGEAPPAGARDATGSSATVVARGGGHPPHKRMKPLYWDKLKLKDSKGNWWSRLANDECAEEIGIELEKARAANPENSKRRSSFSKLSAMLAGKGGGADGEKGSGDSADGGEKKYGGEVLDGDHRLLLEELFAKPVAKGKTKKRTADEGAAKAAAVVGEVKLISGRRAQNVTIAVMKLNMTDAALEDALLTFDEQVLNRDVLELLEIIFPFEDELATLQAHMGSPAFDFLKLRMCERYQCRLISVSRYHERVTVLQLKCQAKTRLKEVTSDFDHVYNACEQLHSSRFHQLLATLLEIGNFCNSGTSRGQAMGYKLQYLSKLMAVKGNATVQLLKAHEDADEEEEQRVERLRAFIASGQGKTMLHYMASVANERLAIEEGELETEMHSLMPASRVIVQALQQEVEELLKGLAVAKVELQLEKDVQAEKLKKIQWQQNLQQGAHIGAVATGALMVGGALGAAPALALGAVGAAAYAATRGSAEASNHSTISAGGGAIAEAGVSEAGVSEAAAEEEGEEEERMVLVIAHLPRVRCMYVYMLIHSATTLTITHQYQCTLHRTVFHGHS
jgi:hypothetical protein